MQQARRWPDRAVPCATGSVAGPSSDRGAVAVEFALLLPLLVMFLFGIIQYGYGLFQYQAFASAMGDASRAVGNGVAGCRQLGAVSAGLVQGNGLPVDTDHPIDIDVRWLNPDGSTAGQPQRLNYAELTGTYRDPINFHIPLVPFPSQFTASQRVLIMNVVPGVTDDLAHCPLTTAAS